MSTGALALGRTQAAATSPDTGQQVVPASRSRPVPATDRRRSRRHRSSDVLRV